MGHVTVRDAQPADLPAILSINAAGWPGVAPLTSGEAAALATGAIRCWVAVQAETGETERVTGYLIVYAAGDTYDAEEFAWFQRQYATFLYVDQIAVDPNGRRGGVGSALYRVAEAYARAQGCDALTCEVNLEPPNPISLSFHRSLGFQEVGNLRTQDGRTVALLHLHIRHSS